ncbi:Glutamate receptor-like 15, partial [Homarus americanus]
MFVLPPDELRDLKGHHFRVVGLEFVPYTNYHRDSPGSKNLVTPLESFDFSILHTMAAKLNFTYEMRPPLIEEFGLPLGDGNWTGTVGTLQHQQADFSLILSPTPERLLVVDFSRIYNPESLTILSLKPKPLPQHLALIRPFEGHLWMNLLASVVGLGVTMWLLQKARSWFTKDRSLGLNDAILYSWGVLLEDPPLNPPVNTTGRMLVGWWMVLCLVITTAYRSSLVAHLTVQTKLPAINSFEDLLDQDDWTWSIAALGGSVKTYFSLSPEPVQTFEKGMELVLQGHHSVITNIYKARIEVASRYTDPQGYTSIHISKTTYPVFAGVAWGFRRGAPFRRSFSLMKQRLIEAGLVDYWTKHAIETTINSYREDATEYQLDNLNDFLV